MHMGGHDQSDLSRDRSRDLATVTDFLAPMAKIGISHLHFVHWHSTTDGRIATWVNAITPSMTLLHMLKIR